MYAGDFVEHKKNLLGVIVGAAGVQLARRVEELDILRIARDLLLPRLMSGEIAV